MVEEEKECSDILTQMAAARGAFILLPIKTGALLRE